MNEIRKLYLSNFVYGFGVMAAFTFTLYFLDNGLNHTQIGLLFGVFLFASALLEIPTGAFADTFGHKTSFGLGLVIDAFYYLVFFFSRSFEGFLLGMIVAAIGLSLESGANTSLIYEILKKEGKEDEFTKVQGRIQSMGLLAVVLSAPLATFIYKGSHTLPYLLSFLFVLASAAIVFLIKFDFTRPPLSLRGYAANMKDGVMYTLKSPRFLAIVLIGVVVATIFSAYLDIINQPYQLKLGVPVQAIGVVQAIASIGSALAAAYAYKILERLGKVWALLLSVLLPGISILLLSHFNSLLGVSFIVAFMVSQRYSGPIVASLQQDEAVSSHRSTMNSVANLLTSLVGALLLPLWGAIVDHSGMGMALFAMGVFILLFGLAGSLLFFKLHPQEKPMI